MAMLEAQTLVVAVAVLGVVPPLVVTVVLGLLSSDIIQRLFKEIM
tara:strand:- start:121 stop:255 length:135 start_codon:yes stop_codon:yes gene_type:complete